METRLPAGLRLHAPPAESETAALLAPACERSAALFAQRWGLAAPADCRVYVMTSWVKFLAESSPWYWKPYLALVFPLVARRAREVWPQAGGWSLSYGRRQAVGVKPARLMQAASGGLGAQFFLPDRSPDEKVETTACHELAHAFTAHLRLPAWLREGLATLAMERYLGRPVVRPETLTWAAAPSEPGREVQAPRISQPRALLEVYARGYWRVRCLDEHYPGLLRALLARRRSQAELEAEIAAALGTGREHLWLQFDRLLAAQYG